MLSLVSTPSRKQREYSQESEQLGRLQANKQVDEKAIRAELQKSEKVLAGLKTQYLDRAQMLAQAKEWEKMVEIKRWQAKMKDTEKRLENGKTYIKNTQREVQDFQHRIEKLNGEIKAIQQEMPDVESLMAAQDWLSKWESLDKEKARLKKERDALAQRSYELGKQKNEILQQTSIELTQYRLPHSQLLELLQQNLQYQEEQLVALEREKQHAAIKVALATHAAGLSDGEPCPLCGALHHPQPVEADSDQLQLDRTQQKLQEAQKQVKQIQKAQLALENVSQNHILLQSQEEKITAEEVGIADQKIALEKKLAGEKWGNSEQLILQMGILNKLQPELKAKQEQRDFASESLVKANQQAEKYQQHFEKLNTEFTQFRIEIESAKKSLQHIRYDAYSHFHDESLIREAEKMRKAYEELGILYEGAEQKQQQLQTNLDIRSGELDSLEKQIQQLNQKLARTVRELQDTLASSEFDKLEQIREILSHALDTSSERNEILRFEQDLEVAKAKMQELSARLAGKNFQQADYDALQQETESLREALANLNRKKGGLQREQEQLQVQLAQQMALQKLLEQLQLRQENLKTLKRLFARSGFVNYVSGIFLRNLCLAANIRFRKLTQGALSLEVSESNSFSVRDYLNDGQLRSIKTLSGGQTFQAALSLALALAEQVQQQVKAEQNFFFIDEGFGSQDKDSLRIIFETLKSLRQENRIVGVISHVEELQQEIDTFLKIKNVEEIGSKVQGSWEL